MKVSNETSANYKPFIKHSLFFKTLEMNVFENIVRKEENAG